MDKDIIIRKANKHDMNELFILSNQDYVRRYSIKKRKINWENHVEWFNNIIDDDNCVFYVFRDKGDDLLGQIRFLIENDSATVSISLSQLIIGKGYSLGLLKKSMNFLFDERREVKKIVAFVSEDNTASIKLFKKADFSFVEKEEGFSKYIYFSKEFSNENK